MNFHLGDILSVTTGIMVSPGGIDRIHQLMEHIYGAPIWTHQMPRLVPECAAELVRQHPFLEQVQAPEFRDNAHVDSWLAELCSKYGTEFEVKPSASPSPPVNPVAELAALMSTPAGEDS